MNNSNDPLTVLHGDELPVQPDPAFAARLRARLESALSLPNRTQGVVMSGTETAIAELNEPATEAAPRSAAIPYLSVANARDAIAWYVDALNASVVGEPIAMDDGRIGHAELAIAGGVLYLADEYPELGLKAPVPQASSVSLMLHVADTDAALERARERGARVEREVYENYGARSATIVDPFGHRWMLSGPMTGALTPIQHGDVGYVSVWTPNADRAAAFYGHVLGWTYDPSTLPGDQYQATDRDLQRCRRHPRCSAAMRSPTWRRARQAIAAGGGQLGEVQQFDFGTVLDATDPQGRAFAVFQAAPGRPVPSSMALGRANSRTSPTRLPTRPPSSPSSAGCCIGHSNLAAWTTAGRCRAPTRWPVSPAEVMTATTVPMWTVADIDAAVARVREAGGTVIGEPSQQSYGVMAECTDDQGARFYLGQF